MIARYNDSDKAYLLVDVDINQWSFNIDVAIDEDVEPFHTSSEIKITPCSLSWLKNKS
jgi:hypothetical protein